MGWSPKVTCWVRSSRAARAMQEWLAGLAIDLPSHLHPSRQKIHAEIYTRLPHKLTENDYFNKLYFVKEEGSLCQPSFPALAQHSPSLPPAILPLNSEWFQTQALLSASVEYKTALASWQSRTGTAESVPILFSRKAKCYEIRTMALDDLPPLLQLHWPWILLHCIRNRSWLWPLCSGVIWRKFCSNLH